MIPYSIQIMDDESDKEFMTNLFQNYHRLMYHEINKIVRDEWVCEDVLQTTIEKLINKVPTLRTKDRSCLVNYVITASKHNAFNYLRDKKRKAELSFDDYIESFDLSSGDHQIEHRFIREDDLACLSRVWPLLDERSRYILEGRYILEKTNAEMAEELNIKPESLRMALTRARKNAYKLMNTEMDP